MDEHIGHMPKPSNRDKILTEGLRVVHERGFAGASVRDIVHAAGVPQGSFTNHFTSKEAFGLEVLDLYFNASCDMIRDTLRNDALPPLQRMRTYFDESRARLMEKGIRNGCLVGNFTAEACDHSESIRQRLIEIYGAFQDSFEYCLRAAVKAGELPDDFDCEDMAAFIIASLQGVNLIAKAQRSMVPIDRFVRILFDKVLR
jgi:TetR/AcrR family transcriptional repressor of nem operon